MTAVVAFVPDLMDRSRIAAAAPEVEFVRSPTALADSDAAVIVLDLGRPDALEAIGPLAGAGRRIIAFGSHVDVEVLEAARAAGATEVLRRSEFFRRVGDLLR